MVKRKNNDLPDITQRILNLVDDKCDGNVSKFSSQLGLTNSSKINRLFNKDCRSGEYPTPSTDIIVLISNVFEVSTDWLLKGKVCECDKKHINNIDISANKINGDRNIISNDSNINVDERDDFMEIIKNQSSQIAQLLNLIKVNG